MKRILVVVVAILPYLLFAQQPKMKNKKYQSLLWEITGNGMKKPSYLFGTMHVSSKLAFHLADSFYLGIRNADVVALETNPESWQEDMSKYELDDEQSKYGYGGSDLFSIPNDYLGISTLRFYKYDKRIEQALYSNPSTINNLLYRSYGNESSDFEEDTYLDMYIYQCGKKWGKKVAGVERYGESMKLMSEAYKDAAKDEQQKERSYDGDDGYSSNRLQEAYRSGNLDWLDSINRYNSFSAAFDEKFLYRRNEIQAASIDSILRSGQSLFVGVGAAHLPGGRGVIEILRKQGYKLRAVKMGARDSQHKNQVEKLRVPVSFTTQQSEDGLYKVDIPGRFYKFGEEAGMDQRQYADMANGSYYMVTRIMTNAWMWGHSHSRVNKIVDSLLYENIPGKIISKTSIVRNGYTGVDITNKTRRGDIQRYNIFVTPFEVVIFKMSGTGEYVNLGDEAKKFFGSIVLKEYKAADANTASWKKYSPPTGGFAIDLPHEPYIGNDGSWIYDAADKHAGTHYRVIRTDIHNYHFAEEDSFDLGLLDESFAASEFIDKQISRKQTRYKGYPALDCQYRDKTGNIYTVRFLIQGPHYYTLVAHGKQETALMKNFLNSFEITAYQYPAAKERTDTSLFYTVKSPVFPEPSKEKLDMPRFNYRLAEDDDETDDDELTGGAFRSKTIANDTTGEKIFVSFFKLHRYVQIEDSTLLDKENQNSLFGDTSWIVRSKKKYETPNKMKVWETVLTDTGSSRTLWSKSYYKDGIGFSLVTQGDSLSQPSAFVRTFYDSFSPADTMKGTDPFAKKSPLFFQDFLSSDSVAHKKAVKGLYLVKMDSTDLPQLMQSIRSLNWKEKKYLETKKSLIGKLDDIKSRKATDYLKEIYYAATDTLDLQYVALEVMLQQKTSYAFNTFRDIVLAETPVLSLGGAGNEWEVYVRSPLTPRYYTGYDNGSFMDELFDSLKLTRSILPDLLPLLNLDDYKQTMMELLGRMVDSNLVKPKDYEAYFSKFLIEARQELRKQNLKEKQKAITMAENSKSEKKDISSRYEDEDRDPGNEDLKLYATLLLPYWDKNAGVPTLLNQMLASNDKRLKYSTTLLLLRNNKPVPDSQLKYFASMDEYRYSLYTDLKEMNKSEKFPAAFNNHIDLAKSKLLKSGSAYDKPDSIVYIDRLAAESKGKKGYVYFFRYKVKKDDISWKIGSVGIVPADANQFEFEAQEEKPAYNLYDEYGYRSAYELTGLNNTRFKQDEAVAPQLNKELKRLLYSRRKSARNFYDKSGRDTDTDSESEITVSVDGNN